MDTTLECPVMMPTAPDSARAVERERMVEVQVRRRGVRSKGVLEAMRAVPREWFVPASAAARAYEDSALPIGRRQTISQPYIVARMSELLELGPNDRVLEIGSGSGYQTAVLSLLAARVYTIEWHLTMMIQAAERLTRLGASNVVFRCSDGSLGWAEQAPFDAIIVTAGAPSVPGPLCEQMADGGRLVAPIGPLGDQSLELLRRRGDDFEHSSLLKCRFVRLRGMGGWRD